MMAARMHRRVVSGRDHRIVTNHRPHSQTFTSTRRMHVASASKHTSTSLASGLITLEEVQCVAQRRGLRLSVKELGPFYRVVCRDGDVEDGRIVGVTSGFVAPWFGGIMHCDTLQIFTRGLKGEAGQRIRGGVLGLGLLLGGATFAYGFRRGCRTAEILAINDDDTWHERLVRYYSYFGFRTVCRVGGNGLSDVPHMLVWGGEGTRMDADMEAMLRKWTPAFRSELGADPDLDQDLDPDWVSPSGQAESEAGSETKTKGSETTDAAGISGAAAGRGAPTRQSGAVAGGAGAEGGG